MNARSLPSGDVDGQVALATQPVQRNPASGSDYFWSALAERIAREVAERVAGKLQKSVPVQKALFNVSEAALYIGRSKSSVQNMIFDRLLPVFRNGRRVHLLKKDPCELVPRTQQCRAI